MAVIILLLLLSTCYANYVKSEQDNIKLHSFNNNLVGKCVMRIAAITYDNGVKDYSFCSKAIIIKEISLDGLIKYEDNMREYYLDNRWNDNKWRKSVV